MYKTSSAILGLAMLAFSSVTFAAGTTPITNGPQALRATLIGFQLSDDLRSRLEVFGTLPRGVADPALRILAARTSLAALATAPAGIVVPCDTSGTITARATTGLLRVLKLDLSQCAYDDFGTTVTIDGPIEVAMLGNSLAPATVLSIRLGDRHRDVTRRFSFTPTPTYGGGDEAWNLRVTGVLPMTRDFPSGPFPGRVTFEASGFYRITQLVRDFPTPGPPYYPQTTTYGADGVFASGEFTADGPNYLYDSRVFRGTLSERFERPSMPNHPNPVSLSGSYRATDLRARSGFDEAIGKRFFRVDGKVEANLGRLWGYPGCTGAETYTFRTRSPITEYPNDSLFWILDGGDLSINGSTTALFSIAGSEPFVDLETRVTLAVPKAGTFEFGNPFSIFDLVPEAGCTP